MKIRFNIIPRPSQRICCNMLFWYNEEPLDLSPNIKLHDHPLSAVYLLAVVTGTHVTRTRYRQVLCHRRNYVHTWPPYCYKHKAPLAKFNSQPQTSAIHIEFYSPKIRISASVLCLGVPVCYFPRSIRVKIFYQCLVSPVSVFRSLASAPVGPFLSSCCMAWECSGSSTPVCIFITVQCHHVFLLHRWQLNMIGFTFTQNLFVPLHFRMTHRRIFHFLVPGRNITAGFATNNDRWWKHYNPAVPVRTYRLLQYFDTHTVRLSEPTQFSFLPISLYRIKWLVL